MSNPPKKFMRGVFPTPQGMEFSTTNTIPTVTLDISKPGNPHMKSIDQTGHPPQAQNYEP